jgi:hypothetical protein
MKSKNFNYLNFLMVCQWVTPENKAAIIKAALLMLCDLNLIPVSNPRLVVGLK